MKIKIKTIIIHTATVLFVAAVTVPSHAIGEFGLGINIGISPDPGNIENIITDYNTALLIHKDANTGTSLEQFTVPTQPVFGINLRYKFNYIFFRFGLHYSKTLIAPPEGTVTSSVPLPKNIITMETLHLAVPVSIAFIIPLNDMAFFFMGAGFNFHIARLEIIQSAPDIQLGLPENDSRNTYESKIGGAHFITGIEVPVIGNITACVEWIHQSGKSKNIKSSENTANSRTLSIDSEIFLIGVNYYFEF